MPPKVIIDQVIETVRKAQGMWPPIIKEAPLTQDMKDRLLARLSTLPLVKEVVSS